jgi:hydroxymethylpyrimidine pyrophosphatase-like HAD family hydrolase
LYFRALATDYDGTLAEEDVAPETTIAALESLKASGRKLVMVTGRPLPDLKQVFPRLDLFDRVVVENGALLYDPATGLDRVLGTTPHPVLVEQLRLRGVDDLAVGKSIIGTSAPYHDIVRDTVAEMDLALDIILNTDAVMILPRGTNKATGLAVALAELGLQPHQVVAVGDAENDVPFLEFCGLGVAVANALPVLRAVAHLVTSAPRGAGVEELIRLWLDDESRLAGLSKRGSAG